MSTSTERHQHRCGMGEGLYPAGDEKVAEDDSIIQIC